MWNSSCVGRFLLVAEFEGRFSARQLARQDYLELRQEASELQEYSNAKLDRVTRYLGVLADKTRKLGEGAAFCRILTCVGFLFLGFEWFCVCIRSSCP